LPNGISDYFPEAIIKTGGGEVWSGDANNFMPHQIDHSGMRDLVEKWIYKVVLTVKDNPATLSYCIANEPVYKDYNDYSRDAIQHFRRWLREKYGNVDELNRIWDSSYTGFDNVKPPKKYVIRVPSEEEVDQSIWYDWLSFNRARLTEYFQWVKSLIREKDKKTPVHIKTLSMGEHFQRIFSRSGVDYEALAELSDIVGCDGGVEYPGSKYALDFIRWTMSLDLLKSIAPEKLIFNSEFYIPRGENVPKMAVKASIWLSYLHGQMIGSLWAWDRRRPDRLKLLTYPQVIEAAGRTRLEMQKLAKYTVAFANQKGKIAILWSWPSVPRNPEYLEEVVKVYEALFFLDTPVRFITEKQVRRGKLKDYKLLVLPRTLRVKDTTYDKIEEYIDKGGKIFAIAPALVCNEYGERRINGKRLLKERGIHLLNEGQITEKGDVYYLRKTQPVKQYAGFLDRIIEYTAIERPVRVTDKEGKGIEGIELRALNLEGDLVVYLINHNRDEKTVRLNTGKGIKKMIGLIHGKELDPIISLSPMDIKLIKIMEG